MYHCFNDHERDRVYGTLDSADEKLGSKVLIHDKKPIARNANILRNILLPSILGVKNDTLDKVIATVYKGEDKRQQQKFSFSQSVSQCELKVQINSVRSKYNSTVVVIS